MVIPGAEKTFDDDVIAVKVPAKTSKGNTKATKKPTKNYTFAKFAQGPDVAESDNLDEGDSDGSYTLKKKKAQHNFYWGNCTRFVAQYKNVDWG